MAELVSTINDQEDVTLANLAGLGKGQGQGLGEGQGQGLGLSKTSGTEGFGQGLSPGQQAKLRYLAKAFDINPRDAQVVE